MINYKKRMKTKNEKYFTMLISNFILYNAFSNSSNFTQSMCLDHVHLPTSTPPRPFLTSLYPQIHIIRV